MEVVFDSDASALDFCFLLIVELGGSIACSDRRRSILASSRSSLSLLSVGPHPR
jgi:hypothetical protein